MTEEASQKMRIYCNCCKQETNHEVKAEHKAKWFDEIGFGQMLIHHLWVCMGCEHAVLQETYGNSEMQDGEEEQHYYPERSEGFLFPKPYAKLNPKLAAIYREALTCYNGKALILCAAGLRALLEGVCEDMKIKGRNLEIKIDGLQAHLPNKNIIRNLHQFRFMGNHAVHELAAPKPTEVALAIEVIEDLLNFLYELNYKASRLREMRRSKKTAKSKTAVPGTEFFVHPAT
jgi:hypothetical protein